MKMSAIPQVRDLVVRAAQYTSLKSELEKAETKIQDELMSLTSSMSAEQKNEFVKTEFILGENTAIRFKENKKTKSGFEVIARVTLRTEVIGNDDKI